jgi:olefin beta-lactone synthetase
MNIAQRLKQTAERFPRQRAVVFPVARDAGGHVAYSQLTFAQLDRESDLLAGGLRTDGVVPGTRLVLMVRFSIEFVSLVFAAFKAGAVIVLVDPGMRLPMMLDCLDLAEPEGFLAVPPVHALRVLNGRRFGRSRHNLTVGRRWFWGGMTYRSLVNRAWQPVETAAVRETDPAAVIFTSGSTGPAKGVIYEHGMFNAQVEQIRDRFAIEPGGVDLSGFPLFALFNAAMGTTTVIPPMDPAQPASADPTRILEAIEDQSVTQSFGSPALWDQVSRHCQARQIQLPSVRRVFTAGAPVRVALLQRMTEVLQACPVANAQSISINQAENAMSERPHVCAEIHTPYGATEALPISSISAVEVLAQTAERTRTGGGTCVGKPFPGVRVKIIEITADPIATFAQAKELPVGQIGEIIVQGPNVTRAYLRRPEADALAKIADEPGRSSGERPSLWHRMGDVGYLDDQGRIWYCGRKSQIVTTSKGPLYTEQCEAIFNEHPHVARSALVGVGRPGEQVPVIIVESERGHFPQRTARRRQFSAELRDLAAGNPLTIDIHTVLFHRSLPVDARHNAKINREHLSLWAANALHGQLQNLTR